MTVLDAHPKSLMAGVVKFVRKNSLSFIRIIFALVIAFTVTRFHFDYIESLLYDGRMRLRPTPATSGEITMIPIDPQTIDRLRRAPDANDHTLLLQELTKLRPKAVLYLIHPTELIGAYDDLEEFAETAGEMQNFYIGIDETPMKGTEDSFRLPAPFSWLSAAPAPSTMDQNSFARDLVTRRMLTSYQGQLFLHPQLAALYNPYVLDESNIRGLFNYINSKQVYINFRPAGTYPKVSFVQAMSGEMPAEQITDKIVIIGRDMNSSSRDYVRTPYSREVNAMTAIEMHANMIDTLILNNAFISLPDLVNLILTALMAILTVYVVLAMKPTRGLLVLIAAGSTFSLSCFLLFWWFEVWVVMAHPILTAFICYYFFIPYRLIMENRKSWEYYQKNKLLTQVEELKTNFLSMMSHDLRTPIARIQGMTDVVLKDTNPLSDRQMEALFTLRTSSDELLEFVSSILNLGRIESKEMKLHLQSKDPNQLLKEIINKYEYLARSKNIVISTELEPVFSIPMDVDLMRQVFSNLIENAIKYSPENSRVLVSTEESERGHVVIQVADQGMGIPEAEQAQVFSKFYRSKNAKSSNIKGSGLGLYLAKYFVELHKGTISVDSSLGQGSTFTVELPTDLNTGPDLSVAEKLPLRAPSRPVNEIEAG